MKLNNKQIEMKPTQHFIPTGILITILLLSATITPAQDNPTYITSRDKLVNTLKQRNVDKVASQHVEKFYMKTCDSLLKTKMMIEDRPISIVLTRLFDASQESLNKRTISFLRIPSVNNYFIQTLINYQTKKLPVSTQYREIPITQSAILASAFDGTSLGDSIGLIVGIREMLNNPYFISTRLDDARYQPYRDTLLYYLANGAPEIFTQKINDRSGIFYTLASNSNNRTVKALTPIVKDNYYEKVLPFSLAILENRTTADSIKQLSLTPSAYYRAFIDETIRLYTSSDRQMKIFLERPIADLNKTLANAYYINEINTLHDSPDKVRFKILDNLSARELYFLLVGGSGQLYTSSFLYVYKKFIAETEKQGLDNFLKEIDSYQFGQFVSNLSVYGLVNDLVEKLHQEQFANLLSNYFRRVLSTQLTDNQIILNSMTLSEILNDIKNQPVVTKILLAQIALYEKSRAQYDPMLQRMFTGFKSILSGKTEFISDATYDVLPVERMKRNNIIVQACMFYDDEDGVSSFESSLNTYDKKNWDKKDMGNYIVFSSINGNAMKVYMNKPMMKQGSDTTQDEMLRAIANEGYEISSYIHRGHSYHLPQSLRKISPKASFVFLGSCGGYNEVLNVFQQNPDVNIIVTRNIGSKLINDPLLQNINEELVNNKDINWDEMWKEFNTKFTSRQTKDLFSSYIPPNHYIGMKFIRKVFSF